MRKGWIGSNQELLYVLEMFGADKDEKGRFLIFGKVFSFMGLGNEIILDKSSYCIIKGKEVNILNILEMTSYGRLISTII